MIEPNKNFQTKTPIDANELSSQIETEFGNEYIFIRQTPENLLLTDYSNAPSISIFFHPDYINVHFINPITIQNETQATRIYDFVESKLQ